MLDAVLEFAALLRKERGHEVQPSARSITDRRPEMHDLPDGELVRQLLCLLRLLRMQPHAGRVVWNSMPAAASVEAGAVATLCRLEGKRIAPDRANWAEVGG
jgi:hypothetical protein